MPGPSVTDRGGDRPPLVLPSRPALSPLALVAVCGVLAAAVVAAAAGATHGTPRGAGHAAAWANRVAVDVVAAVEVLIAVAIVGTVVLLLTSGGLRTAVEQRPPRRRRSWRQAAIFAACVAVALALARTTPHSSDRTVPPVPASPIAPVAPRSAAGHPLPSPDWWLVVTLLGLAGAGIALAGWQNSTRRRRRSLSGDDQPDSDRDLSANAVGSAVRAGLRDLSSETDPRRAVILAYGAMETSLAHAGYGRRRSEAPMEYLGRVLSLGGVSAGAVTELTELFERAGFSPRPVTDDDRRAAGDALRRVDAELAELAELARAREPAGAAGPTEP